MPVISRFFGITVKMYLAGKEHQPPHIHFFYGNQTAAIKIGDATVLDGTLPPKELRMAQKWTEIHRRELMEMWENQNFHEIPPLE